MTVAMVNVMKTALVSGNTIIIGSTISILLALTWGGLEFPWAAARVLTPLIIGAVGILVFFVIEALWIKEPTVSLTRSLTQSSCLSLLSPDAEILFYEQDNVERVSASRAACLNTR